MIFSIGLPGIATKEKRKVSTW